MTAIVGLERDGEVWIGGDSLVVAGDIRVTDSQHKVWRNGPYVFGEYGDARATAIIRHECKPPDPPGRNIDAFMATTFATSLRNVLDANGVDYKDENADFGVLVGFRGRLYDVDSSFYATRSAKGYFAAGTGGSVALGVLHALYSSGLSAHQLIEAALEAAEEWCPGVRRPWTIISTKDRKK